jgi:hypothetical protein
VLLVSTVACATIVPRVQSQAATGTGQAATALFPLAAGLAVFELEHDGQGSFVVRLLDDSGQVVDTLARALGIFRGAKATRVPTTGRYLYDVSAGGRWSIRVRPAGEPSDVNRAGFDARQAGAAAGAEAAREEGTAKWLLGGFAGGAVLGPLGAGGVFLAANSRQTRLSADVRELIAGKDAEYMQAFSEAYLGRRRSSRKTAALVGGTVGTIVFAFAMVQIARWNDKGGSGNGGGNGEVP